MKQCSSGREPNTDASRSRCGVPGAAGRVAIIAEDEAVADSLHMLLESQGYAVERLALTPDPPAGSVRGFDCLLIGQFQPGHRGLALLAGLRAQGVDTHAALITNALSAPDERRVAALGGVTVFEKPLEPNAILAFVARQAAARSRFGRPAALHG